MSATARISWTVVVLVALAGAPSAARAQVEPTELSLRLDVDELRAERDAHPIEGPAVMTLVSAVCVPGGLIGGLVIFVATDWRGDVRTGLGITAFALSGVSFVLLVVGAIWWGVNAHSRRAYERQIREIEALPTVSVTEDGATLSVTARF